MHIDDYPSYSEGKVGVATSSSVCGDYTYQGSFRPGDLKSRDISVFRDWDMVDHTFYNAYLVSAHRDTGMSIYQMSAEFDSVKQLVYKWPPTVHLESPALVKTSDGVYFMFASNSDHGTPNDNVYSTSKSLADSRKATCRHSLMSAADYHTTLRIQTTNGERDFLDTAVTTGNLTCVIPVLQVRNMTVTINDVSRVVPVLPSDNVYEPLTVALHADLRKGSNTITISGFDGEDAPDIDSIMVTAPLQGKNNYQISGP
ncbi:hypothetical protein FS749_008835 [Ceratobasidium sp. UAMH 11750]|nr:hypothetical protein FS749_008835 [Ceratobasidium sp. UAMH 11750]